MIAAADIERARDVQIDEEVARRGIKLRRVGAEMVGPCPHCGGRQIMSGVLGINPGISGYAPTKFSAGPSPNPNNHYPIMTIAQIGALPVGELAHPDGCRLVMWITWPHLHHVPELLLGWGFKYCTGRPWLKLWPKEDGLILYPDSFATGTGYEVINTSEPMMIAKRGRPQRLGNIKWYGHVIAPRREHSRKPDSVRDEIAALFDGPRCELSACSRHPVFDSWGNEVDRFSQVFHPSMTLK